MDGVTMILKRKRIHIRMTYQFKERLEVIGELKRRYGRSCWPIEGHWTMPIADIDDVANRLEGQLPGFAHRLRRKKIQHERRIVKRWKKQDETPRDRRDRALRRRLQRHDRQERKRRGEPAPRPVKGDGWSRALPSEPYVPTPTIPRGKINIV